MKKIVLIFFLCRCSLLLSQQQNGTFSIDPATFNEDEVITVTVSGIDPSSWGVTDLYLWAWYFDLNDVNAGDSPTNGSWENSNEFQKMTDNGDGTFSYTFTPATFYNTTGIGRIGMLIKAKDGSDDKKSQDHLVEVEVGAFQLVLTSPTDKLNIIDSGSDVTVSATASVAADFVLTANGSTINNSTTAASSYNFTVTNIVQNTDYQLQATSEGEVRIADFEVVVRPTVTEASVPAGLLDGINLDPADNTKATLVLYAPGKEFVHVLGDFNNWQIDNNYLMNKDSDLDRFWLELTGLTPQTDHLFQYLVEFNINIADPYSTLILDGFGNDALIDSLTYPNLPDYPSGQTQAITVLRTGDPDYVWQTPDFQPPAKEDLVIYELLIRDFDELHSFDAVKNRLDYLENLGVNAIELMPVSEFDGNESWGYNPAFHMALDKYYGNATALKQLIDECHTRGIAVILDVVYNHATGQHPYYRMWNTDNGGTGGQAAVDNPFFNQQATHSYSVFNDFNHQQQTTQDYVNRTVTYWIEQFNIDGMRWDLTKGFTQNCTASDENCTNSTQSDRVAVLQQYADNQWATDADFYVIFEHLGGIQEEEQWVNYRAGEGKGILLWNKQTEPYNEATMGYHDNGKSNFSGVSYLQKGFDLPSAISYMESHDEERLMYKNLEFGNSDIVYNVKDLNTALARMATAGAFFITVPGPKMIWQFGELGYDVSIDFNGRLGNKPIRWEYVDDPNRKAAYDVWAKLIDLKRNAPIFRTLDFSIDAGRSNGLKKIQLTLDSAAGEEIKYITIIGNFGVVAGDIDPSFQETGTWYNLLDRNAPLEVTDPTSEVTLAPGAFRVFGNNPFIDPNDLDSDGVINSEDQCADTPLGATVDVSGCPIFTLPGSNYSIATTSETCRDSNNGKIGVTVETLLNYTATVNGPNGFSASESFNSSTWGLNDLEAGTYTICFGVEGETDYEQCYDLTITEPDDLSVFSKVDSSTKKVTLDLSGSDLYFVTLNGITQETSNTSITLPLQTGNNVLIVKTGRDCQGKYAKSIFISEEVVFYPNPVPEILSIYISGEDTKVDLRMYGLDGKLVMNKQKNIDGTRLIDMPLTQFNSGQYLIKITGISTNKTVKIVKR